jgi:hypothetical protein
VGNFKTRLNCLDDPHAAKLRLLVESYGQQLSDTGLTHKCDGTLDAVITRNDIGCLDCVNVIYVGFSDHRLQLWSIDVICVWLHLSPVCFLPWRRLHHYHFQTLLLISNVCQPDSWQEDINEMAALYDSELNRLLDQLIPCRQFIRCQRPSDRWFDDHYRAFKRLTRRLDSAYAATCRRACAAVQLLSFSVDRHITADITVDK